MLGILRAFLFLFIFINVFTRSIAIENGQPLLLTPLIKAGKLEEARAAARDNIQDLHSHIEEEVRSFSGYFTVEDDKKSNLFFWFFPAETKPESAPVLLVLKDIAGVTTLRWLFTETGPFFIDEKSELQLRPTRWTRICSMLFIDVPVGAGYSFPTNNGKSKSSTYAEELDGIYNSLTQFFTLFPEFQQQEFYLTGSGHAAFAANYVIKRIEEGNSLNQIKINIKGGIIGSPWLTMDAMFSDEFHRNLGTIDSNQFEEVHKSLQMSFDGLGDCNLKLIFENYFQANNLLLNYTGFKTFYNALESKASLDNIAKYLNSKEFHNYLHAGPQESLSVYVEESKYSQPELFRDHTNVFGRILDKGYKFLFYVPQFDLYIPADQTLKVIMEIKWGRQAELASAQRKIWIMADDVAGYVKQAGNFTLVHLRNAGNHACADQPEWTFEILRKFVANESFE